MRSAVLALLFIAKSVLGQTPRIDSITPSQGPIAGGTIVTITGASLDNTTILLDRTVVTPLARAGSEVRIVMPPHDTGFVIISARNASGASHREFLYVPPKLRDLPPGYITTVAGIGAYTRVYGPAVAANIGAGALAHDGDGNLYICDSGGARIFRLTTDGNIEPFAGTGTDGSSGDGGLAVDADIHYPKSVAFDGSGNAYIGSDRCAIRRVSSDGIISTIAGDGVCGFSGDGGPALQARLGCPTWMAADGDDLFFVDFDCSVGTVRVRRIHLSDGRISTIAGNGAIGFSGDGGPATQASFDFGPRSGDAGALALDPQGNIYLADAGNGRIRRIDRLTNVINTFRSADEGEVSSIAFDAGGNVFYCAGRGIVKLNATGEKLAQWGNPVAAFPPDGSPALTSSLSASSVVIDGAGNIVYSDGAINRVRRINVATGLLESVAGIGPAILGENGPALESVVAAGNEGTDLTFAPNGDLIIGDAGSFRLRRLGSDGTVTTIGGTGGQFGLRTDGVTATQVPMYPVGVEVDSLGAIDLTNRSDIFHVDPSGLLYHTSRPDVALCILEGDGGLMKDARVCQPWDLARDRAGNLFIADTNNNRIRRVDAATNIITTVVGNGGPASGYERYGNGSYCGDGGPAVTACINTPYGIAFDDTGNLFISEVGRLRKVDTRGIITTFVERGGYTKLLSRNGFLYAGTTRFDASGAMTSLAGANPVSTLLGDGGPASEARTNKGLSQASGIAIDSEGNFFFADVGNRRIRAVRYGAVLAPADATVSAMASGSTIHASVLDASGRPAPSVHVDFAAPSSGPSCTLSSPFAITDVNGVASVSCTPNCIAGTYNVTATPLTASSAASVSFTNSGGPCRRRAARH